MAELLTPKNSEQSPSFQVCQEEAAVGEEWAFVSLKLSSLKYEIKSSGLSILPFSTPSKNGKWGLGGKRLNFSSLRCQIELSRNGWDSEAVGSLATSRLLSFRDCKHKTSALSPFPKAVRSSPLIVD